MVEDHEKDGDGAETFHIRSEGSITGRASRLIS